jgi:hypothetical protein
MSFAEGALELLIEYLPVVVGTIVSIVVLWYLIFRGWRLEKFDTSEPRYIPPNTSSVVAKERADKWEPRETSYADRRGSVRRDGPPVQVILQSTSFRNGVDDGLVVDRSMGGLRILLKKSIPQGSTLQVRALNAPENVGYVTVVVRSCRDNDDYFELGCEFEKTPPWNVLLLFG